MKFSQYTLNQVAGFDDQILAQQLVFNQKDFWNFVWSNSTTAGWTSSSTPVDLTGATLSAQIIRRKISNLKDTRQGLSFDIQDYPYPAIIEPITASSSVDNTFTCADTSLLFTDQPVVFTGTVFGGVTLNTTYYVKDIVTTTTFTISDTAGGLTRTLTAGTGTMYINRTAPAVVTLPITNRVDTSGSFTLTVDDSTWSIIAGDPELDINSNEPICFTGRLKISFPADGSSPAYDEIVFLLFLVNSDGIIN